MSLADNYRLGRELVDAEPNRSIMIRRKVETRVPSNLLSSTVVPAGNKFGGLANLRAPAAASSTNSGGSSAPAKGWGVAAPTPRQWGTVAAAVSATDSRAVSPSPATQLSALSGGVRAPTPVAPLASASTALLSSQTLNPHASAFTAHTANTANAAQAAQAAQAKEGGLSPVTGAVRVEKVVGEVGRVDEGDWDVSDEE